MRSAPLLALVFVVSSLVPPALAQEVGPVQEEPDPTRLDVERLPPEAIELTRDLYSHGFYFETYVGTRTYIGGVGDISKTGAFTHMGFGYELATWLLVGVAAEGSIHATNAPTPPSPTAFEIFDFIAEVRLQLNASARAAIWLGGEFGVGFATGEVLRTYGLQDADNVGIVYGGQLGFDWHMRNRHHSFGLVGGARVFPNLQGLDGAIAIGVHAGLYLRYVF